MKKTDKRLLILLGGIILYSLVVILYQRSQQQQPRNSRAVILGFETTLPDGRRQYAIRTLDTLQDREFTLQTPNAWVDGDTINVMIFNQN